MFWGIDSYFTRHTSEGWGPASNEHNFSKESRMPAFAGMTGFGGRSDINKHSTFPKTTLAIQRNSSYLARMRSITSGDLAGLAQLVERFVYTEDVGSSSLSSRTILSQTK